MQTIIKMEISADEIIRAVQRMEEGERMTFIEDLLAATSPDYLSSIREARNDYRAGWILNHSDVFGRDV